MKIALVGNQNSGKTTLFNLLTGTNQKVGNWPGVTIERKEGIIKGTELKVVDCSFHDSLVELSVSELCNFCKKKVAYFLESLAAFRIGQKDELTCIRSCISL